MSLPSEMGAEERDLEGQSLKLFPRLFFCDYSSSYVHTFPPWAECNQFQFLFLSAALAFPFFIQAFFVSLHWKGNGSLCEGAGSSKYNPKTSLTTKYTRFIPICGQIQSIQSKMKQKRNENRRAPHLSFFQLPASMTSIVRERGVCVFSSGMSHSHAVHTHTPFPPCYMHTQTPT